jgi:hypothetical protein
VRLQNKIKVYAEAKRLAWRANLGEENQG